MFNRLSTVLVKDFFSFFGGGGVEIKCLYFFLLTMITRNTVFKKEAFFVRDIRKMAIFTCYNLKKIAVFHKYAYR